MTNLFPLFSSVIKTNGHKLQNIGGKKIKKDFISDRLLQQELQIGLLKCFKKYFKFEFVMIALSRIEKDPVFFIR